MLSAVSLLLAGVSRLPLGPMERYSLAAAGLALLLCGAAIQFMGI